MFQRITQRLPAYKEHLDRLGARRKEKPNDPVLSGHGAERLVKALSLIYEDVINFCQQACKIFATKKGGVKFKAGVIGDVFWKPFDARFSSLLTRLGEHQDLFECELRLEDSKRYQCQIKNTESYAKDAAKETSKIKTLLETLKGQNEWEEARNIERFRVLDDELAEIQRQLWEDRQRICDADQKTLAKKVHELKQWLNAPEYRKVFKRATNTAAPNSQLDS